MIIVRVIMNVRPEKRKELMQTFLSMIQAAGKEKGCLSYDVFYDLEDNRVFSLIEEWKTREDLDRYILSDGFSVLLGTRSLLSRPLEMKIHTVSTTEGAEVINAQRDEGIF